MNEPVRIRLFSVLKERIGQDELRLDPGEAPTVERALDALAARYPDIKEYRPWIRPAVNRVYAPQDVALNPGDELSLITPVSGG